MPVSDPSILSEMKKIPVTSNHLSDLQTSNLFFTTSFLGGHACHRTPMAGSFPPFAPTFF